MLLKVRTFLKLGIINLIRVASYKIALKTGYLKYKTPVEKSIAGAFFNINDLSIQTFEPIHWKAFGWIEQNIDSINTFPNWHKSVLNNAEYSQHNLHWTNISDFSESVGDIKGVWENSRWDCLWLLAVRYSQGKNTKDKLLANHLLLNWLEENPINQGANWKCGQEASIRVLHLVLITYLFEEHANPKAALIKLLQKHLQRIEPTIHYAIGQDNNHGTSEAAALFVGGAWLQKIYNDSNQQNIISLSDADKWEKMGRKWLENRVQHLIENDGSFSQYSMNYHRLMLDTLSVCEFWRYSLKLKSFSNVYYEKVKKACYFLYVMTNVQSGLTPNIGHNDGANLLPLANINYTDYRPSVNFAYAIFFQYKVFETSSTLIDIFDIDVQFKSIEKISNVFSQGGYAFIKNANLALCLKFPNYKFRPAQCDALHLDLFLHNENLLRDAGSFSYNTDQKTLDYFSGVEGHNTVQFDNRQQMPRISRFLWGAWPSNNYSDCIFNTANAQVFEANYVDWQGANHKRRVELSESSLKVIDTLSGHFSTATLRWRLAPSKWQISENSLTNTQYSLSVFSNSNIRRFELVPAYESRYYGLKTELFALEIDVLSMQSDIILTTTISW